ncbi:hypothetical protein [Roseibium alexandrii]|uniref:hypothetical protein n=1 Tax=Roseibium alexandrii TaxID=388408 RepID=UPI00375271ED
MHITPIDPGNMPGRAGERVQALDGYWTKRNGLLTRDVPFSQQQLWCKSGGDGETPPQMMFKGPESFLHQIMEGKFGNDYTASVVAQDPRFARTIAAGYPIASSGYTVAEKLELEVNPPGSFKPVFVEYYRLMRRFQIGFVGLRTPIYATSVYVTPTDEWLSQFLLSIEHPYAMKGRWLH